MHWIYRPFGRRLREARERAGLTQGQLGEAVGLSRTSITNIEYGRQGIPLHALYALAQSLNIEPVELLPEPSERSNGQNELERVIDELTPNQLASVQKILDAKTRGKDSI